MQIPGCNGGYYFGMNFGNVSVCADKKRSRLRAAQAHIALVVFAKWTMSLPTGAVMAHEPMDGQNAFFHEVGVSYLHEDARTEIKSATED